MNIMDRYIGQGMGKYIEKEIFSATKSLLFSSPSISISFGKRLFKMAENGVEIKVITSDKTGTEGDKTNLLAQNYIKPTIPLDYKVVSTKEVAVIHAKIYIIDGKCAITGSANLTENSFWNFAEYVSITRDSAEIKQIEDDYNKLWNNYSYYQVEQSVNRSVRFFARNLRRKL